MGLLGDSFDDPRTQQILGLAAGLLSANGSQGLSAGILGMNNAQDAMLKRQDLAQQIQLRNIALQQQQQEWALQLPLLKAMADRLNGAGQPAPSAQTPPTPSQPAIPPMSGTSLGSGTFGIPLGGQDAVSAPQAPQRAPVGGSTMFPGVPDNVALPTAAFGGFKAVLPLLSKYNEPTDLMKTMAAQGLQPGTPEWNKALADNITKSNYIAPTNIRGFGIAGPQGLQPLPMNAPQGFMPSQDANGNWNFVRVGGDAVRLSSQAKTAGEGDVLPFSGVDANGNPLPVTNRTAAATQGAPQAAVDNPNIPPSTPYQRGVSDVSALQREIALVQNSMDSAPIKQGKLDVLNAELAKAQVASHVDQLLTGSPSDVIARIAGLPPEAQGPALAVYKAQSAPAAQTQAAAPVRGAIYAAPPLGTVTNADASQRARGDSMKESYTRLQSTGSTANMALDALDKMLALASDKNPLLTAGPLGTHQSAINPSAAEYEKQRANVIALMAQQLGAGGTDAGRANIAESVPDFGKPKDAIADGLGTLKNQIAVMQMKRNLLSPVYQSGDSNKYTTLENQFDQNISPAMVPLLAMPPGPAKKQAIQAAVQNPAMRARMNWAITNGLVQ